MRAVALGVRAVRRRDERVRIVELGHQAVNRRRCASPSLSASVSVFVDLRLRQQRPHLEDRDHRQEAEEQEQQRQEQADRADVGATSPRTSAENMPHDDGRKSRCRLVTTMTNRSSHMPMLTIERDDEQRRRRSCAPA